MSAAAEFIAPNTVEWLEAKRGCLGGSQIHAATAKQANGKYYATREKLLYQLAAERLTDLTTEHYVSRPMQWGLEHEAQALAAYEWKFDVEIKPLGWVPHPRIAWAGCTPDGGAVGLDGLVEAKCPESSTHTRTMHKKEIAPEYLDQMYWQLACTGRAWCDYLSFDPRMPEHLQLHVLRLERNEKEIARLEAEATKFLDELAAMIDSLQGKPHAV